MTNDRSGKQMGETAKTYLKELYREMRYGIRKDITSKYIEKGLMVEDSAIAFYSSNRGDFYFKNEEHFSNDFLTGTPDIVTEDEVIDIKSSWNIFTLPFKDDPINKNYYYQLMGYMALTGRKKSKVAYVLIDTPSQLIEDEKRRLSWQMGYIDDLNQEYLDACLEIDESHDFSHIPLEERIIEFNVLYDEKVVESIYKRVEECRDYLSSL